MRNPVIFVVEVVSVVVTIRLVADIVERRRDRLRHGDRDRTVVHGAVRELRRGDGGGSRQGAGRVAAPDPCRPHRAAAPAGRHRGVGAGIRPAGGRPRDGVGRRARPRRRRHRRGHRLGGRVGHHRRVGARDPRVRRRPLGGHRRHEGALGLDPGAGDRRAGRGLHRSDDPPRRGRRAPEDAQRDRAVAAARRSSRSSS